MHLIDVIEVRGAAGRRIELWEGDLTDLGPAEAVDALVVSAFPDNYAPTPGSLIGALHRKGLSVDDLAQDKDIDIRATHSCWLSHPFTAMDPGLRFHRVLGFEPLVRGRPPELVGDIFRALGPILVVRPEIRSIALPIVAAGDQGEPIPTILDPLLDAAIHWLEAGLPLDRLAIVAHSEASAEMAASVFGARKTAYLEPVISPHAVDFDVFVSYAHTNGPVAEVLVEALRDLCRGIRVFVDRHELVIGAAWQPQIFESLERSRKVVALLSPDYLASKACLEEFSIACIQGNRIGQPLLFPILAFSADLPAHMTYRQYADAREGDPAKLRQAASLVVGMLGGV